MQGARASSIGLNPLEQADNLAEGVLWIPGDPVEDRQLLAEARPEARLEAPLGAQPRSSLGANGLSEAPPDASGCSTKKFLFFSMKFLHSAGTLSPG